VNVDIKKGLATSERGIAVETSDVNFVGTGNTDFRNETLGISIVPVAKKGLGLGVGSAVSMFQYEGVIASPKLKVNTKEFLSGATSTFLTIVTGGTYLLAKQVYNKITNDKTPCKTALDGRFVVKELDPILGAKIQAEESAERKDRNILEKVGDEISKGARVIDEGVSAVTDTITDTAGKGIDKVLDAI